MLANSEQTGLAPDEAARLLAPFAATSRTLQEPDPDREPKRIAAYSGNIVLYISILMFGQFVMMGVMEEKASRVVEVVLSRAPPRRVLAGKVSTDLPHQSGEKGSRASATRAPSCRTSLRQWLRGMSPTTHPHEQYLALQR